MNEYDESTTKYNGINKRRKGTTSKLLHLEIFAFQPLMKDRNVWWNCGSSKSQMKYVHPYTKVRSKASKFGGFFNLFVIFY